VTTHEIAVCVGAVVGCGLAVVLYELSRRIAKDRRQATIRRVRKFGFLFVGLVVVVDALSEPLRFGLLGAFIGFFVTAVGVAALHRALRREPL
jgi:integral membrane sensor domain MASE1